MFRGRSLQEGLLWIPPVWIRTLCPSQITYKLKFVSSWQAYFTILVISWLLVKETVSQVFCISFIDINRIRLLLVPLEMPWVHFDFFIFFMELFKFKIYRPFFHPLVNFSNIFQTYKNILLYCHDYNYTTFWLSVAFKPTARVWMVIEIHRLIMTIWCPDISYVKK